MLTTGKVEKIQKKLYKGKVYDLEIKNNKSYNINGFIVHNSVSASLLTWFMDITKMDPIKYNFVFERFLNPARKTRLKIFDASTTTIPKVEPRPNKNVMSDVDNTYRDSK